MISSTATDFERHLCDIRDAFNAEAARLGLPCRLNVDRIVTQMRAGAHARLAHAYEHRPSEDGIVHETQAITVARAIAKMLDHPREHGVIVGSMQSGKTGTSFALHWAALVLYMVRGEKVWMTNVISNRLSHGAQAEAEMQRFTEFYGDLEIEIIPGHAAAGWTSRGDVPAAFAATPSLHLYHQAVIASDAMGMSVHSDILRRRSKGAARDALVDGCIEAHRKGFLPVLLVDEPQFGAVDHGDGGNRPSVLRTVLDALKADIGDEDWILIGLSATPFEMADLSRFWKVMVKLSPAYVGLNFFNGSPIDPAVTIRAPEVIEHGAIAARAGVEPVTEDDMAAYRTEKSFDRFVRKTGYVGSWMDFRADVAGRLKTLIEALVSDPAPTPNDLPRVVCLRLTNSNALSDGLLLEIGLDPSIEVVRFYGGGQESVKGTLDARRRRDAPAVMVFTGGGRMADAFPREATHFLDYAKTTQTLNALLQGFVGRACGYGKDTVVALGTKSVQTFRRYVRSDGSPVARPSRGTEVQGAARRRPSDTTGLVIRVDGPEAADPVLARVLARIQAEVVGPTFPATRASVRGGRGRGGPRLLPLPAILEEEGVVAHVRANARRLFPGLAGTVQPVSPGGELRDPEFEGGRAVFEAVNGAGEVVFRDAANGIGRSGRTGRGRGQRAGRRVAGRGYDTLVPEIGVRKVDARGVPLRDASQPGEWRLSHIVLPLAAPVTIPGGGGRIVPIPECAYEPYMTDTERGAACGVGGTATGPFGQGTDRPAATP